MPDPVENHLGNGATAVDTFASRFVIDRLGQAGFGAHAIGLRHAQQKTGRRLVATSHERPLGIAFGGFFRG